LLGLIFYLHLAGLLPPVADLLALALGLVGCLVGRLHHLALIFHLALAGLPLALGPAVVVLLYHLALVFHLHLVVLVSLAGWLARRVFLSWVQD
jgi:hypothetical protein